MSPPIPKKVKGLSAFPSDSSQVVDGKYVITCDDGRTLEALDDKIQAEIWFKSPVRRALPPFISIYARRVMPNVLMTYKGLDHDTISKIDRLQLFTDSRDQGEADVPSAGNWTWFELVILEDETAFAPRVKDGVELVWKSHDNNFLAKEYGLVSASLSVSPVVS